MDTPSPFSFHIVGPLRDGELVLRISGHRPGDAARGLVPSYEFELFVDEQLAGRIDLRIGYTETVLLYVGQIGYYVMPVFRGQHYAERACRLLLPLARAHGMAELWITCNPDNIPSRRTCERLGAALIDIIPLPEDSERFRLGERQKCRYRLAL